MSNHRTTTLTVQKCIQESSQGNATVGGKKREVCCYDNAIVIRHCKEKVRQVAMMLQLIHLIKNGDTARAVESRSRDLELCYIASR